MKDLEKYTAKQRRIINLALAFGAGEWFILVLMWLFP